MGIGRLIHRSLGVLLIIFGLLFLFTLPFSAGVWEIGMGHQLAAFIGIFSVAFAVIEIGIGIGLVLNHPLAVFIGLIYFFISFLISLFTLDVIGLVVSLAVLILLMYGSVKR